MALQSQIKSTFGLVNNFTITVIMSLDGDCASYSTKYVLSHAHDCVSGEGWADMGGTVKMTVSRFRCPEGWHLHYPPESL